MIVVYGTNPHFRTEDFIAIKLRADTRLIEKVGDTLYLMWGGFILEMIEKNLDFKPESYIRVICDYGDGFYFICHQSQTANYLGSDWMSVVQGLQKRGLAVC